MLICIFIDFPYSFPSSPVVIGYAPPAFLDPDLWRPPICPVAAISAVLPVSTILAISAVFPVSTGLMRVCFQAVFHNFLHRFRVNSAALRQCFIDRRHKIGLDLRVQRLQIADHTLNLRPDRQGRVGGGVPGWSRRAIHNAKLHPDGWDNHIVCSVHAVHAHVEVNARAADYLRRDNHFISSGKHVFCDCASEHNGFL